MRSFPKGWYENSKYSIFILFLFNVWFRIRVGELIQASKEQGEPIKSKMETIVSSLCR